MLIGKRKKKEKAKELKNVVEPQVVSKTEPGIVQVYLYGLGGGEFAVGNEIDDFFLRHGYSIENIDIIDCPLINKHREDYNSLILIMTDEKSFRKELACEFMKIESIQGIRIRLIYLPHLVFFGLAELIALSKSIEISKLDEISKPDESVTLNESS